MQSDLFSIYTFNKFIYIFDNTKDNTNWHGLVVIYLQNVSIHTLTYSSFSFLSWIRVQLLKMTATLSHISQLGGNSSRGQIYILYYLRLTLIYNAYYIYLII